MKRQYIFISKITGITSYVYENTEEYKAITEDNYNDYKEIGYRVINESKPWAIIEEVFLY